MIRSHCNIFGVDGGGGGLVHYARITNTSAWFWPSLRFALERQLSSRNEKVPNTPFIRKRICSDLQWYKTEGIYNTAFCITYHELCETAWCELVRQPVACPNQRPNWTINLAGLWYEYGGPRCLAWQNFIKGTDRNRSNTLRLMTIKTTQHQNWARTHVLTKLHPWNFLVYFKESL